MRAHVCACPECERLLAELKLICNALGDLKEYSPRANYKLQLSNCLQYAMRKPSRAWVRSLALGVAVVAALFVLLWPEQPHEVAERRANHYHFDLVLKQPAYNEYAAAPPHADYPAYSWARIQTVSY